MARAARFRRGEPWRPWLLTIVANEARSRRRSAGRRSALALGWSRRATTARRKAAVLVAETRGALLGALSRLREDDRLVLGCRYLLELSEAETAARAGRAAGHGEVAHVPRARTPARGGRRMTRAARSHASAGARLAARSRAARGGQAAMTPDLERALREGSASTGRRRRAWPRRWRRGSRRSRSAAGAARVAAAVVAAPGPARSRGFALARSSPRRSSSRSPAGRSPCRGALDRVPLARDRQRRDPAGASRGHAGRVAGPRRRLTPLGALTVPVLRAHGLGTPAVYATTLPDGTLRRLARLRRPGPRADLRGAGHAVHAEDDRLRRGRRELTVDGAPAYWIAATHGFAYQSPDDVGFEDQRIAGRTLLVERADGLLLRIEGVGSRERPSRSPRSVRDGSSGIVASSA